MMRIGYLFGTVSVLVTVPIALVAFLVGGAFTIWLSFIGASLGLIVFCMNLALHMVKPLMPDNAGSLPESRKLARFLSYWLVPLFIFGGCLAVGIILVVYPSSGVDIRVRYWPSVLFPIATLLVVYDTVRIFLHLKE